MSAASERTAAFCDYARLTLPSEDLPAALSAVMPFLEELGGGLSGENFFVTAGGAQFQWGLTHGISFMALKGRLLAELRAARLLNAFLAELSCYPHRLTMAHLTVDEYCDDVPARITGVYRDAVNGLFSISRKALRPRDIRQQFGPLLYGDPSRDTGTVYLGSKSAERRLTVYDKRQERISRNGQDTGHNIARFELVLSDECGITLRDVADPERAFYHFIPSHLLSKSDVGPWVSGETGFVRDVREVLVTERLRRRVENSAELDALVELASKVGPEGGTFLKRLLSSKIDKALSHSSLQASTTTH